MNLTMASLIVRPSSRSNPLEHLRQRGADLYQTRLRWGHTRQQAVNFGADLCDRGPNSSRSTSSSCLLKKKKKRTCSACVSIRVSSYHSQEGKDSPLPSSKWIFLLRPRQYILCLPCSSIDVASREATHTGESSGAQDTRLRRHSSTDLRRLLYGKNSSCGYAGIYLCGSLHPHRWPRHCPQQGEGGTSWDDRLERVRKLSRY